MPSKFRTPTAKPKASTKVPRQAALAKDERPSKAELREMALAMVRLRRLDERMVTLQRQGRLGFHGTSYGEEAAVIGSGAAAYADDWIVPALRQGAIMLWRGYSLETYLAQSFGCALDPTHGRQMPCHPASPSVNQVSWSSCIGNQIPQGAGIAFAMQKLKQAKACLTYMGDGATSEADFHYGMNFAAVWKAPCVFVCQNNQWAISVPVAGQSAESQIFKKASAYGMPGERVDGNDLEAVWIATRRAVNLARSGGGPTLLELLTYRAGPHSTSDDPSVYRDEVVGQKWFAANDPLKRIVTSGFVSAAEVTAEIKRHDAELDLVIQKLEATPLPSQASLFEDVYTAKPWHLIEQAQQAAQHAQASPHGKGH